MKELTFEEAADWAMGEFFTESGDYSDLVHIVNCMQSFDDIGLEPIEEYEDLSPYELLKKVDSLALATKDLSTHGIHNIKEVIPQDELVLLVLEQFALRNNKSSHFDDAICNEIDNFITELQDKGYKAQDFRK